LNQAGIETKRVRMIVIPSDRTCKYLRTRKAGAMESTPVLIIDDEQAAREGLKLFLEDEGYEVFEAQDGPEGLKLFRAIKPDLVLTDIRMPGMSGMEVIGEIRKLKEYTAVIVFTGYGSLGSAIDAIHLNVFDFIIKPIDLKYLKQTLDRARDNLQTARQLQIEMAFLREQLTSSHSQLREQIRKFAEIEPFIQTGQLLAGILHDLSNPLTTILGHAEYLQHLHPEIENTNVILNQGQRMKRIMEAIMQRVRSSKSRSVECIHINRLLQEEVLFLECQPYFKHDIIKIWDLGENLPPFLGITMEMNQVFGNILRNAAEAMIGQRVKRLTIRTWHDTAGIHVSIQDTGPGIPWHQREQVFQPFFSTKSTRSGMMGDMGMGIGLYYCRQLVQRYGGEIQMISEGGAGANFVVHLPVCSNWADASGPGIYEE
jgi:signal transduction histidine kinase